MTHVDLIMYARRLRWFWVAVGFVLAGVCCVEGAGYLIFGNRIANNPSWYIIKEVYGGMRVNGAVMLVLGMLLGGFIHGNGWRSRIVLRLFCAYSVLVAASVFGSWWITRQVAFGTPWSWLALAAISAAMIHIPVPPLAVTRHRKVGD
jgi:hypothetical protein